MLDGAESNAPAPADFGRGGSNQLDHIISSFAPFATRYAQPQFAEFSQITSGLRRESSRLV
jgi:hypothetical protein